MARRAGLSHLLERVRYKWTSGTALPPRDGRLTFHAEPDDEVCEWWRLAKDESGNIVGFGIPSRNPDFPVVGYLGVLPEHRGRGHAGRILTEITRILVEQIGADVVQADTDLGNRPMAEAFERAGYRNFACRLVLSAIGRATRFSRASRAANTEHRRI